MKAVFCAVALLLCGPAWSINKCTGPDGKVIFQDAICEGRGEKIVVKPASGNAAPVALADTSGTKIQTEAERLDAMTADSQRSRRRRELQEQRVPYAQADLYNHKNLCQQEQTRLENSQYDYVQNLYGKTHAAQKASEMAAAAARCDTRDREFKDNLEVLRKECQALNGCK